MEDPIHDINPAFLHPSHTKMLFENSHASVPVLLRHLPDARILWLNERAAQLDPRFKAAGECPERYKRLLLDNCAFAISGTGVRTVVGWADRYGGFGIGGCGGSGRAAYINGYHVKGVGRTPLAGLRNDPSHSTGAVFITNAVADTIYGEAMSAFPASSVPNLAIIDTGQTYVWPEEYKVEGRHEERKVLVVRPGFLRPAHFERANDAVLSDPRSGFKDTMRVKHLIRCFKTFLSPGAFGDYFFDFFGKWAAQMAFGLVNGINQYNISSSNISLSGSLLDFEGTRVTPRREWLYSRPGIFPFGAELNVLLASVTSIKDNLRRYDPEIQWRENTVGNIIQCYNHSFALSLIRRLNIKLISNTSHASDNIPIFSDLCLKSNSAIRNIKLAFSQKPSDISMADSNHIRDYMMLALEFILPDLNKIIDGSPLNLYNLSLSTQFDMKKLEKNFLLSNITHELSNMEQSEFSETIISDIVSGYVN